MDYRAKCKVLIRELKEALRRAELAEGEVDNLGYALDRESERAARARRDRDEAEYQAEKARKDAEWRDYEREKITRDMDRARSYGNDYEVERCLAKLKRL